jgi:mono/diheme cytochrome c family protein
MKKMTHFQWAKIGTLFLLGMVVFQSCKDEQSPGYEYMPNMYRSPSLETYGEYVVTGDTFPTYRQPVENTIPQGFMPYPYPNTAEGYAAAGENLKNPIPFSEDILAEGKAIYTKMCIQCHGKAGKGDGTVASNPRWPGPPPAYDSPALKDLPEGKIFHSIHFGKGLMGAHNSLITQEDRWKLVHYVQYLQDKDRKMGTAAAPAEGAPAAEESESAPAEREMAVKE